MIEESDDSLLWLEYLVETGLMGAPSVKKLQSEANELVAIFTASQKTVRANYALEKNRRRALRKGRARSEDH